MKNLKFKTELLSLEMRLVSKHSQGYKFGILYAKKNQTTENEFFRNQKESKSFREFLEWIGTIITLKGWEGEYTGGLDVKSKPFSRNHPHSFRWHYG
jgi:hypothetical protein